MSDAKDFRITNNNNMNTKQLKQVKEIIESKEKDYDFNDYIDNYIDDDTLKDLDNTIEDIFTN